MAPSLVALGVPVEADVHTASSVGDHVLASAGRRPSSRVSCAGAAAFGSTSLSEGTTEVTPIIIAGPTFLAGPVLAGRPEPIVEAIAMVPPVL